MKCNIRELALLSDQPCIMEGRLNYKKVSNGSYRNPAGTVVTILLGDEYKAKNDYYTMNSKYMTMLSVKKMTKNVFKLVIFLHLPLLMFKERWFRLINNYLFYFKISEMGKFDTKNPAGMFVMENSSIQMEHGQNISFSFSISFIDEPEKRHIFAARSEDNVVQWVMKLRECSYEYLRNRLHALQSKIYSITGKDPLLMVPRNEGACLWAPSVPFSTTPACTVNTSSFSCHLHTNGAFTLERSKSDVQAHKHLHTSYTKNTTFYTDDHKQVETKVEVKKFALEKSKTSAIFTSSLSPIDASIFDNRPAYSRAAPSPPVRLKLSPGSRRAELLKDLSNQNLSNQNDNFMGVTSWLAEVPVPPRRKLSPRPSDRHVEGNLDNSKDSVKCESSEDLIQF